MRRWLGLLWLVVLGPCAAAWASDAFVPVPPLAARVTDLTGTLTPNQQAQLEAALAAIERERGAQIAVLLLPSVRPESIEQFGIRLAEAWRLGRKGGDDGAILIVAKNDRELRIEVGYGLEGAIPDAAAKRIIEETIVPRFRQGDFHGGIAAGVGQLEKLIAGEALPAPAPRPVGDAASIGDLQIFILFALAALARFARALFGLLGALAAAGVAGALALMIFGSWLVAAVAALLVLFLSFARGVGGSGWHSGGRFPSSGSGGFSGGGGGFGGGGASGRW